MDQTTPNLSFLGQDLRSESTLPLLNFCLQSKPDSTVENSTNLFHKITASIGVEPPPIPDESEQLKTELLKLVECGAPKVTGSPTVRFSKSTNDNYNV